LCKIIQFKTDTDSYGDAVEKGCILNCIEGLSGLTGYTRKCCTKTNCNSSSTPLAYNFLIGTCLGFALKKFLF